MTMRKIFIRFCNNIRLFINEINKSGGWNFSKLVSMDSTFIREMRVDDLNLLPVSEATPVNNSA